ncbi:MAG: site-2 protease family protein, partial [Anaerolineae bacterium]|nr:site-2 protease family protein [Gemmatimonadaceae bacterium]
MIDFLRGALAIVFVFGIVVFVHELGHFLAAKFVGVYTPRFSIGFGPTLWSRKWGETEYIVAALPLGGYVRMASREDEHMARLEGGSERPANAPETVGGSGARLADEEELAPGSTPPRYWDPNAMAPFGPVPVPEHRLFESKSLLARLFILSAGVTMNFLLAVLVLAGTYLAYGNPTVATRTVGNVTPLASAPSLAEELVVGDTIFAIDGKPVANWGEIVQLLMTNGAAAPRIRTHRGEFVVPVGGSGEPTRQELVTSIQRLVPAVIDRVLAGGAARTAGLLSGDTILAINGTLVQGWAQVVSRIESSPGESLELSLGSAKGRRSISVKPDSNTARDPRSGESRVVGKIGASVEPDVRYEKVPLGSAIAAGWSEAWGVTALVGATLRDLATGRASPRELGGIIQIASESTEAAKSGFDDLLRFLA